MKKVKVLLLLFIIFYFLFKTVPLLNNNFFFTMDQGDDAVNLRNMVFNRVFYWHGPLTAIDGLYTGPLWYYFLLPAYLLFNFHPFGAVFMLILLNLALSLIIFQFTTKILSPAKALIIIFSLQFFWDFYDTSRYAFNPFPAVFLTFMMIVALVDLWSKREKSYYFAALAAGFSFHFEIAYALPLSIFFFLVGFYAIYKHFLRVTNILKSIIIFLSFFLFHFVSEWQSNFDQFKSLIKYLSENQSTVKNYWFLTENLLINLPSSVIFPFIPIVGFLFYLILTFYFLIKIKKKEIKLFVILSNLLLIINFIWFILGPEWQTWHTISLPILLFVSVLLMIFSLPRKISLVAFCLVIIFQLTAFVPRYLQYFRVSDDPSILANEIKAVDWVYEKAGNQGYSVYNYLPSVLDYPYQYLFWWRGFRKYGYLPCEYASYPGSPEIFIPNKKKFTKPKKCGNLRFLIIEPNKKNPQLRENWIKELKQGYKLIEEGYCGKILMQKYLPN